tara:strand:+ start:51952 stop:53025 length:1074 start_codon:yes stop_codon:yes gene_type:complete
MRNIICTLLFLSFFIATSQEIAIANAEKIATAKETAQAFLVKEQIPGMSIAVSQKGTLLWSEGFGYADIASKTKVVPGTQFRLASISKPITAVGLAILADRNQLDYNESVYTYLPDFPKKKYDFTVKQVGGHLAGIRHYKGNEFILNKKMSITEGLSIFKNDSLMSKPGTNYQYSTYGWNLLSEVIQQVAKVPFNKFMTDELFRPLKMTHTELDLSDQKMPNRTLFYIKTNSNSIVLGPPVSNEHKVAGGGFIANAEDLLLFGNEIIHPTHISEKNLSELLVPQNTSDGKSTNYGIGFGTGTTKNNTPVYSHSGGGMGATTYLLIYPKEELVIVVLTNLSQVPIRDLTKKLEDLFID